MDNSPGSDGMDWEEDSSLHIIQPASSPWRKRSYDTYNDTNEPYYANHAYSGYQVTDTLGNHTHVAAPYTDSEGRPAQYVTDSNGNVVLQPIIQPEPRQPIGYYLPELVKWVIYGATLLFCSSVEIAGDAYIHSATVAVRLGDSAKRRLVEITKKTFAPAPSRRRHRRDVPPHRRRSNVIRRVSPTSPRGRTHIPVTPPRARPTATLKEAAFADRECIIDYIPSDKKYVRSGAFATSAEDGHLMSGITHHPCFEALMSGALQDIEMGEDSPPNVTSSFSPYHIPGTFPDSPALTGLPSTESLTSESQAGDDLATPQEMNTYEPATSGEQTDEEVGTPHSETSDESYMPDAQPTIVLPLQQVDSRPRNYKGELLDEWQIQICREFQAIHPPPKIIPPQAINIREQTQGPNYTGLIQSHQSPLANKPPITPHQPYGTTTAGLIDSHRSPLASVSRPEAVDGTMALHGSTAGLLHQPHGMSSIGLNDSHRSPLDHHSATTEVQHYPHVQTSVGLKDSHRSPLDLHDATTEDLDQPSRTASIGSSDSYRSPLADAPPTRAGAILNDSDNTASKTTHDPPGTATSGSIDSRRSPLADVSPTNSPRGTNSIGSIDSPRSPLVDASLIHLQLETSSTMAIDLPGSPLTASSTGPAVNAMPDIHKASLNISEQTEGVTPVPLRTPPTSLSGRMTTAPAKSPSKWSIRSLYARVQGKPTTRSPLCERVNNGNIHKVPKTPKKVTWPENGPVTGTKRFMKHKAISYPSPSSSREDSSILSSVPSDFSPQLSPTMQEEEEEEERASITPYQIFTQESAEDPVSSNESNASNPVSGIEHEDTVKKPDEEVISSSSSSSDNEASVKSVETPRKTTAADPSTPPSHLSPKFEELTISTRRSSLRRREKEDRAQKRRDAIAAEEKARKDKEEAEEKARKEKEEAEERTRIKAEEEKERKKTGGRRMPIERVIQSLPTGWDEKIRINMAKGMREQLAMTSVGNPLTRRDFGMALPQHGTGDDPSGWLNDEIISGYLQAVVDHGHHAMGHPRGAKPRMHAFTPFFYTTLKERGYDAVKRWSSRAKIGGNDLKNVEYVFIPCNPSRIHWTLVVVSPVRKTIEVFDSMHGSSLDKVNTTKMWLRGEMGRSYVDSEWTVVEDPKYPGRGKGPVQDNPNDCGVFTVTTAKMLVLGVDPMAISAADMPLQRRRLVAELLNGGFSGEFKPRVVFG